MPNFIGQDSHISQPPEHIQCSSDGEAIQHAKQLCNGLDVELWDGARFIERFSRQDSEGSST